MKLIVWMIREILKMLNQYAVDNPTLPVNLRFFPPFRDLGGMLSRSLGLPSRNDRPPRIWDTHGISGNVFANPTASSSTPYPQGSNPWVSNVSEHTSHMWWVNAKHQPRIRDASQDRQPEIHSTLVRKDSSNNYGADQQRLQISDPHFDKFTTSATFACWKTRFKTEVCTCSQFPTEAMHWTKEVEMVESVDDLKSSSSTTGIPMPNFEVLDARIASALNKIIHNSQFKRRISLEEQQARKRTVSFVEDTLLPDLWMFPGQWSQRFCRKLHRPVHYWCSKWGYSGVRFKVGRNFIVNDKDSTWRHLWRIVQNKNTRVWETQDLYDLEIHWKKMGPDYHRLKTMVRRISSKMYEITILAPETEIMKETLWSRIQGQNSVYKKILEIVGNGVQRAVF